MYAETLNHSIKIILLAYSLGEEEGGENMFL
jgi:HD superfamily phosphodiesterase